MKRRSGEINIFSMSALDLFASALGAFILIAIVLFPYFPNIGASPEDVAALRAQLNETRQQLQTCRADLAQTRSELQTSQTALRETQARLEEALNSQDALRNAQAQLRESEEALRQTQAQLQESQAALRQAQAGLQKCAEELRKKFILIVISWGSADDVDLHVIDPRGNEYYYDARSYRGSEAKLEEDNTRGPGNEIWLHPKATPGEYKIYYKLYNRRSGNVSVRGAMLTPNGRQPIPTRRLSREGRKPLVAVVRVDNDGNATLQTR